MINKDISDSKGFSQLSPHAAVLFCMMIPHYSSHGKLNGTPEFIKGEVCPRIPYLTVRNIPDLLTEISERTSVKWFRHDGRMWIHSTNFLSEHQNLNKDRLGQDLLPTYSGLDPDLVTSEVEVEVEVEGEGIVTNSGLTPEQIPGQPIVRVEPKPAGNGRFTPPTVEQVREYCGARHNDVDPIKFHAHYSSNGWRVGKNPMKNWRAAIVTWERGLV
jgi:hypothetical protein